MEKTVGNFTLWFEDENDLFYDNRIKFHVLRNGRPYGIVYKNGKILKQDFYNCNKNEVLYISLHNRLYERIMNKYYDYTDNRLNNLIDNYSNDKTEIRFHYTQRLK